MCLSIPFYEDVVEPALNRNGIAPSGRVRDFFAGEGTPGDLFTWPARQLTGGVVDIFAEPIQEEFRESMDYLFDQKINPTISTVNYFAEKRISQGEEAAKNVVTHAANNFKDIISEGENSAERILDSADRKYKDSLRLTFHEINGAVSEAILGMRATIGQVDTVFEMRIRQASDALMDCIARANQFPGLIRTDLVDPTFDRLKKLEEKFFSHLDHILDELGTIIAGTVALEGIMRERVALATWRWWIRASDPCRIKWKVQHKGAADLDTIELYRVIECHELEEINQYLSTLTVNQICDKYHNLQSRAWLYSCFERGSDAARDNYLRDWEKYGRLYKLWRY